MSTNFEKAVHWDSLAKMWEKQGGVSNLKTEILRVRKHLEGSEPRECYVMNSWGDMRLKALLYDGEPVHRIEANADLDGLLDLIKKRKNLEEFILRDDALEERVFKSDGIKLNISDHIVGDIEEERFIISKKRKIVINGKEIDNVLSFMNEYLSISLKPTGFEVVGEKAYAEGNNRVHLSISKENDLNVSIVTQWSCKTLSQKISDSEKKLEDWILMCEFIRNYIVNHLRSESKVIIKEIEI
jgi:hypothetical protein